MSQIITIDGPASSGKDSVGKLLAKKLHFQFIDTGAIYRAGTFKILEEEIPITDKKNAAKYLKI